MTESQKLAIKPDANAKVIRSKFYPHDAQVLIRKALARFKMVFAGRRFGKSVYAVNQCIERGLKAPNQRIWYCSPLYKQTKEIAWNLFKEYCPSELVQKWNEAELKVTFINGSEVSLKGTDNPESLVGVGLHFVVLDEAASMKKEVWYQAVRPMLIDTKGEALFIGTPRGFNWLYHLWNDSINVFQDQDFKAFFFKTVDNTAIEDIPAEVAKARREATSELDQVMFRQEYEASFESISGRPRFDIALVSGLRVSAQALPEFNGLLAVYHEPEPFSRYVMGCDTSEGLESGDNSSVTILNTRTFETVAHYSGKIAPDILATYVKEWGEKYNQALAVVECNNHGLVTLNYLKDIYSRIYYRKTYDKQSDVWTEKIGFQTSSRTKPLLIGKLDKALRSGLKVASMQTIDELTTYVIGEDGETNASEGKHDDDVISLALAVQGYNETYIKEDDRPKERQSIYMVPIDEDLRAAVA